MREEENRMRVGAGGEEKRGRIKAREEDQKSDSEGKGREEDIRGKRRWSKK